MRCARHFLLVPLLAIGISNRVSGETPKVLRDLSDQIAELGDKVSGDPSPTPHRKKKHPVSAASPKPSVSPAKQTPNPKATPEENNDDDKPEGTPKPTPKHRPSAAPADAKRTPTPTPTPESEASPGSAPEDEETPKPTEAAGHTSTIASDQLKDFATQPERVRKLIQTSLDLAGRGLGYTYGSAAPSRGGMDCSGFIYYVLQQQGLTEAPRDSSELYIWVRKAGTFRAVIGRTRASFEFDDLRPGDLLFWTGTYDVKHDPPVSHTMIYLGRDRTTGKDLMIGSSDGRTYLDEKQSGVSVFDFKLPGEAAAGKRQPTFVGYARIPGLRE